MQHIVRNILTNGYNFVKNNSNNNDAIFYRFIGNFIQVEWRKLTGDNGKALSKTSKQLLSLIVFRLQIYYNKDIEELQESYYFFEESLSLRHRRVRQCLVELGDAGFIDLNNRTIVKNNLKLCNTPCIKLIKNFQHVSNIEKEKTIDSTQKNFGFNLQKVASTYI
ncbi:hypothetical protein OTUT144_0766 [Orientia tsutsugamushi str. UT144]|uniref:Uncharacterized protein n=1 Tax=Orientia tsutsugamushi str. UT144 TaxID=1441384 RepID=A0A0F3RLP1_ORITS|nr:hypothetical protein [Orientia tsutsugamushi]KJW07193.1 hypothetical protein OTUT144_0766 [Orientia tsutsugamushi str. UT144]